MRERSIEFRTGVSVVLALFLLFCACSEDPGVPTDTTPPAAVKDLVAIKPSWDNVTLTWTAPGDDERTGTAAQYDIRYSISPLTEAIWPSAVQATGEPSPRPAGSADTFVVTGLSPTTMYYFALKTADAEGNWSEKSIIASASTTNAVTLAWTAPGDDGAVGEPPPKTAGVPDTFVVQYPASGPDVLLRAQNGGTTAEGEGESLSRNAR